VKKAHPRYVVPDYWARICAIGSWLMGMRSFVLILFVAGSKRNISCLLGWEKLEGIRHDVTFPLG
jgi:hypothetical protein